MYWLLLSCIADQADLTHYCETLHFRSCTTYGMASCQMQQPGYCSTGRRIVHCIGSTADTDDCLLLIALGMVAAAAEQGGSAAEALQKPLHILHGILRDVASRLALNEAVVWVRSAAKAPPWAKLLRAEKSVLFSMGVRSVSSHVQTTHRSIGEACAAERVFSSMSALWCTAIRRTASVWTADGSDANSCNP